MEFLITDNEGHEIGVLDHCDMDIECGGSDDFELEFDVSDVHEQITFNSRIFTLEDEFGGLIKKIKSDTSKNTVTFSGLTWRGLLKKKIIEPPSGKDYRIVSGDITSILIDLIDNEFSGLIRASKQMTGRIVRSFQLDRYVDLYDGLEKMLDQVGYKLVIRYVQGERGSSGYVQIKADPINDYSNRLEFSQDYGLNFIAEEDKGVVNHLICLGKGELKDRIVYHLYLQQDGSIGQSKYYVGSDEIVDVYDSNNSEGQELIDAGKEKFMDLIRAKKITANADDLSIEADIGDIVGGRDFVTGFYTAQPIERKIYKRSDEEKIEYRLKGDE